MRMTEGLEGAGAGVSGAETEEDDDEEEEEGGEEEEEGGIK